MHTSSTVVGLDSSAVEKRPDSAVGVIGSGEVAERAVARLARRGWSPLVCDLDLSALEDLKPSIEEVSSPGEVAASCEVALVAVDDAEQAREALVGLDGLLTADRSGLVVVLMAPVPVREVHVLAALCVQRGAVLLDAGTTGSGTAARGELVMTVGGPDEVVQRVLPVLEDIAASVVHCGPLGTGTAMRMARNMVTYSTWAAIHEARSIAEAAGVSDQRLMEVLGQDEASSDIGALDIAKTQLTGTALAGQWLDHADDLAQKDLAAAQEYAGDVGLEVPIIDIARAKMRQVYTGAVSAPLPENSAQRGRTMMDRVYGPGFSSRIPASGNNPLTEDIVNHLFTDIWSRTHLTVRDRRLLVLGITAMLGRADLLEVQLRGALANGEFTAAQLDELPLMVSYYAGVGNATLFSDAVRAVTSPPPATHGDTM